MDLDELIRSVIGENTAAPSYNLGVESVNPVEIEETIETIAEVVEEEHSIINISDEELENRIREINSTIPVNTVPENTVEELEDNTEEEEEEEDYYDYPEEEEEEEETVETINPEVDEYNIPLASTDVIQSIENQSQEGIQDNLIRFSSASWFDVVQEQEIILAGLGGIGGYVSFLLSRLNPKNLILFDNDLFEAHNLGGQLCRTTDIQEYKVRVASNIAQDFSSYYDISDISRKYVEGEITRNIMICGFDNMQARKVFFESWLKRVRLVGAEEAKKCLYLDGRLLAETFQIFCVRGDREDYIENYQTRHLFGEGVAVGTTCTLKQTSHIAMMIASKMVTYLVNHCNNINPDNFPRRYPYYTHYDATFNIIEEVYEDVNKVY